LGELSVTAGRAEQPRGRRAVASLRLSDTGSAAASDLAAALMLATSELLASTGRAELGVERVERVERAAGVSGRGVPE
jgi:hypothetical protein